MLIASIVLAAIAAIPTAASADRAAEQPVAAATPAPAPPRARRAARPTSYCVEYMETGLRIPRRDCRTRDEWLKEGFDPLAPN